MRSEKAKKFIESNTLDLDNGTRMDTTGYVSYAVSAAKAYGAIEIAEQERIRVADAIHISLCPCRDDNNNCSNDKNSHPLGKCTFACPYIHKFRELMYVDTEIKRRYTTAIQEMKDLREIDYAALRQLSEIGIPINTIMKESSSFDDFLINLDKHWNENKQIYAK